MTVLSWVLQRKIKSVVGKCFKIDHKVSLSDYNAIIFKSQKVAMDEFCLYYEALTEYEILEIAKILSEVCNSFSKPNAPVSWTNAPSTSYLNSHTEASGQFAGAVINLKGSALHKLLLLTSGNRLLSKDNLDLTITLAKIKKKISSFPEDMSTNNNFYNYLKNHYILPGISARTVMGSGASLQMNEIQGTEVESTMRVSAIRVMAFLANNSESVTLAEHLKLDLPEAVTTRKSLVDLRNLITIQQILMSGYRELAESMMASELRSLSFILESEFSIGQYPKDILRNRSAAMRKDATPTSRSGRDSIVRYLSDEEKRSLSSLTFVEHVDGLVSSFQMQTQTAAIIYAALAEVFAVKGERKTLEIARELKHLNLAEVRSLEFYEATVGLIALALESETEDFPLSWTIQLSEHSWVLTSHLTNEKLSALAL